MNENQIKEFIQKHNIKNEIEKAFESILKANSTKDLDIKEKNIFINVQQIQYKKTHFNFHSFGTPIKDNNKTIGLFALEFTDEAEIIDEFFIIY